MAKQNQPKLNATSDASALSATDSLTDTAAALGSVGEDLYETTTSQPAASAATAESSQPQQEPQRKSWLDQEALLKGVNQLPQSLKDLGTKAADQFNGLSSTQKIVGGALLVSGLSWLALRGKKSRSSSEIYAPYNPKAKGESKWKASNEPLYRGASSGLHDTETIYGTENGF